MLEKTGSIWEYYNTSGHTVGVTTNGVVKNNGHAVMGAGVALEASIRAPSVSNELGASIRGHGQYVTFLDCGRMFAFPTKKHWSRNSDHELISKSVRELAELASAKPDTVFVLPRPGCGNGGLLWEHVRPLLLELPDNVWVVSEEM